MNQIRETKGQLAAGLVVAPFIATNKMRLFKSTFVPSQTSTYTDFDAAEVAFTGYGPFTMAGGYSDGLDAAGNALVMANDLAAFDQTGTGTVDTVGGWFIEDTAGSKVLLYNSFEAPVSMDTLGNGIRVKAFVELTEESGADVELIFGP